MKPLIPFLSVFFFFACSTEQPTSVEPLGAVSHQVKKVVLTDTLPPQRSTIIRDLSRPVDQIQTTYPFDIELKTTEGKIVTSDQLLPSNGKPTVLLFWLTTCYPCRLELKAIQEQYAQWQSEADFNLLAISTDFQKNFSNFVDRVAQEKWPWPAYNDHLREFRKVMPGGLNGLPQTFVLNAEGEVVYHARKYRSGDEQKLFESIKAHQ